MKIELNQAQKMLEWLKTKMYLDCNAVAAKNRSVKRGQVYRCNFGCGIGSEMQKDRPAVIVQNDVGNNHSGNTIVIPITHDTSTLPCVASITPQIDASGNAVLDGQANASNMMCVSKARLGSYVCDLSSADMKAIDEAIAKTVCLISYYAELQKKLADKLQYITKIKEDRNKAQDELSELRKMLGLSDGESIEKSILEMQKAIDSGK